MIGALDDRSRLALSFEFEDYAFEFLGCNAWTYASGPLPRFVLNFRVTCPRCYRTFSASLGELSRQRVRAALAEHSCRPLAIEPVSSLSDRDPPRFVDRKVLERRQRDALFEQNVQVHGPIDPGLPSDVRRFRVELYESKRSEEIAEIWARRGKIQARAERREVTRG